MVLLKEYWPCCLFALGSVFSLTHTHTHPLHRNQALFWVVGYQYTVLTFILNQHHCRISAFKRKVLYCYLLSFIVSELWQGWAKPGPRNFGQKRCFLKTYITWVCQFIWCFKPVFNCYCKNSMTTEPTRLGLCMCKVLGVDVLET